MPLSDYLPWQPPRREGMGGAGDAISRSLGRWLGRGRRMPFGMDETQFRDYVGRLRRRPNQQNAILAEMGIPFGAGPQPPPSQPPPPMGLGAPPPTTTPPGPVINTPDEFLSTRGSALGVLAGLRGMGPYTEVGPGGRPPRHPMEGQPPPAPLGVQDFRTETVPPPEAPPTGLPDAEADRIVREATNPPTLTPTMKPPPNPGFFEGLMTNPAFMAGLSILGTAPGGNWGPAGARGAALATRSGREQSEYERLTQRRSTMDRVWSEAFPNGQPNPQHPLLAGVPPEMMPTVFALGPEAGLPELQRFAFARAQQDLQLRLRQRQLEMLAGAGGAGGQPPPTGGQPPPATGGVPGMIDGQFPETFPLGDQPPTGQPPPTAGAPPPTGIPEPTVNWMGRRVSLSEAERIAQAADAMGVRNEPLERAITDARAASRPPETVRTRAIQADTAYRTLDTLLTDYVKLVERTGATVLPGRDSDAVRQARNQILLQLKELNNLGVLNGPDLALMETMLVDPGVGMGWTGPYGGPNMFGGAAGRVRESAERLRELLRGIRNTAVAPVGIPPIERSTGGGSGGANDPLGIR